MRNYVLDMYRAEVDRCSGQLGAGQGEAGRRVIQLKSQAMRWKLKIRQCVPLEKEHGGEKGPTPELHSQDVY